MYLDAIHEREMPMAMASAFWLETLRDYEMNRPLALPFDRHRLSDEQRTGRGTSASFDFGEDLSRAFLAYATMSNTTPELLSLACYFAFLFKLTNGERDLCVGMNTHRRYKDELQSIIGMFVNAIPLRLPHLDPCSSFSHIVEQVREMATRSVEMLYFPLQRILAQHSNSLMSPAFLDTSFDYHLKEQNSDRMRVSVGEAVLATVPYSIQVGTDEIVSKFDFSLTFQHDQANEQLSCKIDASLDLFDKKTVQAMAQRFDAILHQLFLLPTFDITRQPIFELSLLLPDEVQRIQSINESTKQMNFQPLGYLHEEFARQAYLHPQKISVCLDEQSLTHAEVLAKVCQLVAHLGQRQRPGEIICQCVERSIEMIIGQLAIIASGGCYCPLSPADPPARLAALVSQTKSQLVLVHPATANHFSSTQRVINLYDCLLDDVNCTSVDIDDTMFDAAVSDNDIA